MLAASLLGALLLGGCRSEPFRREPGRSVAGEGDAIAVPVGNGARPGNDQGPGGFVPRGRARNFYAGAGGRLWYYLNNYYWAPDALDCDNLWIKAEVRADFCDLVQWPQGGPLASPPTKHTVEYWAVGPGGRTVRLDNHKDYWLLEESTSAGAVAVEVTLTLGRVRVQDARGAWVRPGSAYVLESRNYNDDPGLGAERTQFEAHPDQPVTVWRYRIPWSTAPARLTRSQWQELRVPTWALHARRAPPTAARAVVTTPGQDLFEDPLR